MIFLQLSSAQIFLIHDMAPWNWQAGLPDLGPVIVATLDSSWWDRTPENVSPMESGVERHQNVSVSFPFPKMEQLHVITDWQCVTVATKCPDLPDPRYGSVKLTGNRVGDKANYRCNSGFRLDGQSQRKCLVTGDWSGEAPTCVRKCLRWSIYPSSLSFLLPAITCPDLPNPQYGSVKLTGNRVGDKANYRCDFGFRLVGLSRRKCLATGKWSGQAPKCVRKSWKLGIQRTITIFTFLL